MSNFRYTQKRNKEVSDSITREIAKEISADIGYFMIDLRNALEDATPKETRHGAINWLIRKGVARKEYGERSMFPSKKPSRHYNQPMLSDSDTGIKVAENFDILSGRGMLVLTNTVDYITELNDGTSPFQDFKFGDLALKLEEHIGFIEKTIADVEGKHGM